MKYLKALFGLSLIAAATITGACVTEESAEDDGNAEGGSGAGQPIDDSDILFDSPRLGVEDLERRTYHLASPELQGRAPASEGGLMARQYIIDELNACGVAPLDPIGFEQPIAALPGAANLLAVIPGTDEVLKDRYVMLAAHYDHLGVINFQTYAGADDNAASVSTMLSIACALNDSPQPRSVIIAAFDSEEPPNFLTQAMGSVYYVNNPVVPLAQTDVMIALELIGNDLWPGYQNHMVLGSELSPQVKTAVDQMTPVEGLMAYSMGLHLVEEERVDTGGVRQPWSDYDAFRNNNIPVMLMVNAYTSRYHTPQDTPDSLNYPKMGLQAKYILQMMSRLANLEETPVFDAAGADYLRDAQALQAVLSHAVQDGWFASSLGLTAGTTTEMQGDLDEMAAITSKMTAGDAIAAEDVTQMRYVVQRLMCLTSGGYGEETCNAIF